MSVGERDDRDMHEFGLFVLDKKLLVTSGVGAGAECGVLLIHCAL